MKTFANEIKLSGVGIHSGRTVNMLIRPHDRPGIFFKRIDLDGDLIPATYDNVGATNLRNTTIGIFPNCVQTIEHLMSALFIFGIDSALIEIDGPEMPILDGSAKQFCELFGKEKTTGGGKRAKRVVIKKEIIVRQEELLRNMPAILRLKLLFYNLLYGKKSDGFVRLYPYGNGLLINSTLVYKEHVIGTQSHEFLFDYTDNARKRFMDGIAAARTFGKYSEWEYLKKRGMARGANENNVIALNDKGDSTLNALRWTDEFVRHKIIDILGDMYLGGWLVGGLESYKGSHALNNMALKKLFSSPDNYEIV